jgi:hypothetical protein
VFAIVSGLKAKAYLHENNVLNRFAAWMSWEPSTQMRKQRVGGLRGYETKSVRLAVECSASLEGSFSTRDGQRDKATEVGQVD